MTNADDWDETPSSATDPFPSVRGKSRLLGVNTEGRPIYYDEDAHARRDAHPDGTADDWHDERSLDDSVTVGDLVDDVEEAVGWDELTDYARDHLPGVDDAEGDAADGGDDHDRLRGGGDDGGPRGGGGDRR